MGSPFQELWGGGGVKKALVEFPHLKKKRDWVPFKLKKKKGGLKKKGFGMFSLYFEQSAIDRKEIGLLLGSRLASVGSLFPDTLDETNKKQALVKIPPFFGIKPKKNCAGFWVAVLQCSCVLECVGKTSFEGNNSSSICCVKVKF